MPFSSSLCELSVDTGDLELFTSVKTPEGLCGLEKSCQRVKSRRVEILMFVYCPFHTRENSLSQETPVLSAHKEGLRCLVPGGVCISPAGSWPGSWRRGAGGRCHAAPAGSRWSAGSGRGTGRAAATRSPGRAGRRAPAGVRVGWGWRRENEVCLK